MLEQLSGKMISKEPQHIVVDINGVGFGLDIPLSTYNNLPKHGENVNLYTHLYLQEDALRLYGFLTEEERDIFEVLINTSGIGPKMSLGILSSLPIEDFASAIASNDIHVLTRIPGIGKKTAERLVVELKGKLEKFAYPKSMKEKALSKDKRSKIEEAIQAMISLGSRPAVAQKAVWRAAEAADNDITLEELIKESLKYR